MHWEGRNTFTHCIGMGQEHTANLGAEGTGGGKVPRSPSWELQARALPTISVLPLRPMGSLVWGLHSSQAL